MLGFHIKYKSAEQVAVSPTMTSQEESFDWLHIDFTALSIHASSAGWDAEIIDSEVAGHYL